MKTVKNNELSIWSRTMFDQRKSLVSIELPSRLFSAALRVRNSSAALLSLMMMLLSLPVHAMTFRTPSPVFTLEGSLNCPVISEIGGTAYLQLTLLSPALHGDGKRKPMNLSVVIDRSGSMSDQRKMEFAKKAFSSLIDQLQSNDVLSLVVYDDVVTLLRSAKKVGDDKRAIKRMLDEVYPRNSTNLGGGLLEGLRQAERYAGKGYVNRVVLLSDGLANVGLTDPTELNRIARQYRGKSISVTSMGVGLDYNENLMMGLSESGGGNYYFIEHPNALAAIVRQEFNLVSSVVAQNGAIYLTLGDNIHIKDAVGCEFRNENGRYIIPVGDIYANERREFTVELSIPRGSGKRVAATGEFRYESERIIASFPSFSASVRYSNDVAEVEKHRDINAQAKADIAVSAKKVEEALKAMDRGDRAEADMILNDAVEMISASPAASASGAGGESLRDQLGKIDSYRQLAKKDSSAERAKKMIQYENYKTRKNK